MTFVLENSSKLKFVRVFFHVASHWGIWLTHVDVSLVKVNLYSLFTMFTLFFILFLLISNRLESHSDVFTERKWTFENSCYRFFFFLGRIFERFVEICRRWIQGLICCWLFYLILQHWFIITFFYLNRIQTKLSYAPFSNFFLRWCF